MTTANEIDVIVACDEFQDLPGIAVAMQRTLAGKPERESVLITLPGGPAAIRKIYRYDRLSSVPNEYLGLARAYESAVYMRGHGDRVRIKHLWLFWHLHCQFGNISSMLDRDELLMLAESSKERVYVNFRLMIERLELPALGRVGIETNVYPDK